MAMLIVSMTLFDAWITGTFFSWLPESILQFSSSVGSGGEVSMAVVVVFFVVAFVFNGIVGPVVEELYFQGRPSCADRVGSRDVVKVCTGAAGSCAELINTINTA